MTQWSLITAATPNPPRKGDTSYKQRTERRVEKNQTLSMLWSETRGRSGKREVTFGLPYASMPILCEGQLLCLRSES